MSPEDFERQIADLQDRIKSVACDISGVKQQIAHCEEIALASSRGKPISDEIYGFRARLSDAELKAERRMLMEKKAKLMDEKAKLMEKENQLREVTKQLYEKDNRTKGKLEQGEAEVDKEIVQSKEKTNDTLSSNKVRRRSIYMKEMLEQGDIQEGKYLILSKIYDQENSLGKISNFGTDIDRLAVRHCYQVLAPVILERFSKVRTDYVYVTGTPGIGKTMFRNYMVWYLLQKFKKESRALRIIMAKGGENEADLLCLEGDGEYYVEDWKCTQLRKHYSERKDFVLGNNLFCLADVSRGKTGKVTQFRRGLIVFTSPNREAWRQEEKQDAVKYCMPLWTLEEIQKFNYDVPVGVDIEKRFLKYDGVVRLIWASEETVNEHEKRLLDQGPTIATLVADVPNTSDDSVVQHRFIYLETCKDSAGNFLYSELPVRRVGSKYIASILSRHFSSKYLSVDPYTFSLRLPHNSALLFERISFHCLAQRPKDFAFLIKPLGPAPHHSLRSSKSSGPPSAVPSNLDIMDQFIKNPASHGFWYLRPPSGIEEVHFNGEKDVMDVVNKEVEKHRVILATPLAWNFAGFDGFLVWKGTFKKEDTMPEKVGTKHSRTSTTQASNKKVPSGQEEMPSCSSTLDMQQHEALDSKKYALLLQATKTTNGDHPLSATGAMLLERFVSSGFQVAIVYIVPPMCAVAFKRQRLQDGDQYKKLFSETTQWCLYMNFGQPQGNHRQIAQEGRSKKQKSK